MPTPDRPAPAERANANIARHLARMAAVQPDTPALKIPRGRTPAGAIDYLTLTFAELDTEVAAWGAKLAAAGIKTGDRTLVMVKPGLPLIASVFALFRIGAVPVVIDPGMGLVSFLRCVAHSRPRALVGIPFARLVSRLAFKTFASVEVRIPASGSLTARLTSGAKSSVPNETVAREASDLAAILFTSGSTGAPKGVCYEHGMFEAQVKSIRDTYDITPGEIDLPMLPIFALFNPALGMTTVVPEIDPRRPAEVDPEKIVRAIQQENVTNSFGSPTLWLKVATYCDRQHIKLPSLLRVLSAGAPVPSSLWELSRPLLPNGRLHSPYGATEALPVASVSSNEIDVGVVRGACVGRPVAGIQLRIIRLIDGPIATLADAHELAPNEIGEIIVSGPVVTQIYDNLPEATLLAKIQTPNSKRPTDPRAPRGVWPLEPGVSVPAGTAAWHRMGDCGYLDFSGRLWFTGRKAERVTTPNGPMFTEPCEQVFRLHPDVVRCALIGLGEPGKQRAAVVVEAAPGRADRARAFAQELRTLAVKYPHTAGITRFFFHPKFPVDVRHNAKIHRLQLARWAETAQGVET